MLRYACFYFCLLISVPVFAQHYYETYSPGNGLVDARVTKMIQGPNGCIFFLTRDGFSIYDGQRMLSHTKYQGKTIGIVNEAIRSTDGNVYLSCFNGQWLRVDKRNNISDSLIFGKNITEVSEIINIGQDQYLITSNSGTYIFNKTLRNLEDTHHALPDNQRVIDKLSVTGNYIVFNYYLYRETIVYLQDMVTGRIADSVQTEGVININTDKTGNVYLNTSSGTKQLHYTDLQNGKLIEKTPWFASVTPPNYLIENLFFDEQGNTWFINNRIGCYKIDVKGRMIAFHSPENGLLASVSNIFQDREKNYWFIAPGKGVQKLMQSNYEPLTILGNTPIDQVYYSNSSDDSSLFVYAEKYAVVAKKGQIRSISSAGFSASVPIFYWGQNYWTYPSSDYLVSNEKKKIPITRTPGEKLVNHYPSPHVAFDNAGNALITGNTFVRVNKDQSAVSHSLPYFADNIVPLNNNSYYIFCRSNDVLVFTESAGQWKKKKISNQVRVEPRFAIQWNKDTFCIASRQYGIYIVKIENDSLIMIGQIDRTRGLSNDFVETLLKINDHQFAAGTASGLDIISMTNEDTLIENISKRINHFEPILQLVRGENGMIYCRTEDYRLFQFDPAANENSGFRPDVWFHSITINNQPVDTQTRSVGHTQNNFSFAVSAPSFYDNRQLIFHFKITGAENTWEQKSNRPEFGVDNLPPGSYKLDVFIKYPGRQYEDNHLSYSFRIRLPFWKTWWFISLIIIGIISLAILLTRNYYKRRLQKREAEFQKQKALENERTRIATDMHDDFGASLSRIKFISEKMQVQQTDDLTIRADLEKISGYSDEMAEKLGEIVWALNQRYDSAGDLVSFCRSYASEYLEDKNIRLNFSTGVIAEGKVNGEVRRNIFLVMKEALHNIVKHAGASQVNIEMSCDDALRVVIEDNGKGFDPASTRPFANGLENMKKRVYDIGGNIEIDSVKGTRILIIVDRGIRRNTYS